MPASDLWIAALPSADVALTPRRDIDIKVLRKILDASREGASVDVFYQSMNTLRPELTWRRITPHAFGYDGFRWHARAYCHLEHKCKDFLLPRILDVGVKCEPGEAGDRDWLWNNYFDVIIGPPIRGLRRARRTSSPRIMGWTREMAYSRFATPCSFMF